MSTTDKLDAEAAAWIARNGLPWVDGVRAAIAAADRAGDPEGLNSFREALLRAAEQQGSPARTPRTCPDCGEDDTTVDATGRSYWTADCEKAWQWLHGSTIPA